MSRVFCAAAAVRPNDQVRYLSQAVAVWHRGISPGGTASHAVASLTQLLPKPMTALIVDPGHCYTLSQTHTPAVSIKDPSSTIIDIVIALGSSSTVTGLASKEEN